jgi:hypothetical protein
LPTFGLEKAAYTKDEVELCCCGVCRQERSRESGRNRTEWLKSNDLLVILICWSRIKRLTSIYDNTEILREASKETGLEVSIDRIKHWAWDQTRIRNKIVIITSTCSNILHHLRVFQRLYLATTPTIKREVHDEIRGIIKNSRNPLCYLVQKESQFRLLSSIL